VLEEIIESKGKGYVWTPSTLKEEFNKTRAPTKQVSDRQISNLLRLLKNHWIFKNSQSRRSNMRYVFVRKK